MDAKNPNPHSQETSSQETEPLISSRNQKFHIRVERIDVKTGEKTIFNSPTQVSRGGHISAHNLKKALASGEEVNGYIWKTFQEPKKYKELENEPDNVGAKKELALLKRNLPTGFSNNEKVREETMSLFDKPSIVRKNKNDASIIEIMDNEAVDEIEQLFKGNEPSPKHITRVLSKNPILKVDNDMNIIKTYSSYQDIKADDLSFVDLLRQVRQAITFTTFKYTDKSTYDAYQRALAKRKQIPTKTTMEDIRKLSHLKRGLRFV